MDQPLFSGTAHDPSGSAFALVGISNLPTDWAQVFKALAGTELRLGSVSDGVCPVLTTPCPFPETPDGQGAEARGLPSKSLTPPSVLDLNAYLMYSIGKAARRRLSDKLTARGLRLWHLTAMAMLNDLGPQTKTVLAKRLDMNPSDLVKVVDDLVKVGHAQSYKDSDDRRRVVAELTPAGRAALAEYSADISTTDEDLLAPLDEEERHVLASLLQRVHNHLV
ncbi:MarR family winged helix-turn-helix transcriptional regulator [Streptomyces sp. NPDC059389]|uniref:MarR family winged helix-turn-helix transcriptional regulator n=1 Tax=Streptomyces sp. NPDC059389 TaxID=3346818 RepID=UPI0036BD1376